MLFIGKPGLAPRSRWTYHQHLSAYCTWLIKAKLRKDNPLAEAPVPRRPAGVPRPVLNHQLERILTAAGRRRTKTMILLAALAGLRVHEIAKLHGRDVDLEARTLRVIGKGGKDALIPMHELLVAEAQVYPRDGFWFPSYLADGATPHISRQSVSATIGAALTRAGVDATAHQLRHWYGTSLLEHGVDIRIVQELMRHSSLQSTQIYTKVSGEQRQIAIAKL
ncbi:MAG: tyrosine-type recombinase/integrase, partial [Acidobacteria bacterium]|nr:tyrosine-type recombinase/integrase [Acidobacteriota bacterium]